MNTYKYQQFCPLYFPKFWKSSQVPPSNTSAKSLQSCPTLCDLIDSSPPGSSVPGTLQARTPEWVAISFSNAWKWKVKGKSLSCPTLCDPTDYSLPCSSVHGICQARVMEWGAINTSTSLKKKKQKADEANAISYFFNTYFSFRIFLKFPYGLQDIHMSCCNIHFLTSPTA